MSVMTPEQAKAYLKRWEMVREAEAAELRHAPIALKFRQLESLMASRDIFADDPKREEEIQTVRERWILLRQAAGA